MSVLKKEFIDRMAETGGITKKAARLGLDLFIETLIDCMNEGEKVMFNNERQIAIGGRMFYTGT